MKQRPLVIRSATLLIVGAMTLAACSGNGTDTPTSSSEADTVQSTATTATTSAPLEAPAEPSVSIRDSGLTVTVQPAGDLVVHTMTAPEEVFANATHIIETANSLVVVDTQFLLPMAQDFRAYADGLGKPINRVFITHEHPDHFLGSEAFADLQVFALQAVSDSIAANGDAEVAEKQGDFGPEAIASTYVVPAVVEAGTVEIDGVVFELNEVVDAEAEIQLVIRVPEAGIVATGDIVYSGVHLIFAGPADTWTEALNNLAADSDSYPIVLPGHGLPADPNVYDANIAWLATAGELLGSVDDAAAFKQGLVDAFPDLGMTAAIDFVTPFLFPEE
ncbi:MAG: MBL fold metallo-hydrolase [Acidimicrobiia bacterium]|nr:MBL fold metallo-hydrolase [Acidimicrobiia bacterium]